MSRHGGGIFHYKTANSQVHRTATDGRTAPNHCGDCVSPFHYTTTFICNAVSHAEYIQQMLASSHGCATEFTAIIHVAHPRNVDEIGEIDRLAKSTAE